MRIMMQIQRQKRFLIFFMLEKSLMYLNATNIFYIHFLLLLFLNESSVGCCRCSTKNFLLHVLYKKIYIQAIEFIFLMVFYFYVVSWNVKIPRQEIFVVHISAITLLWSRFIYIYCQISNR